VIGAFALHAYGRARATVDLDFVTVTEAQPGLVEFLLSLGYETLHLSAGYSNHSHPDSTLGRVDFVYVSGETAGRLFEAATTTLRLGAQSIPVPKPEHLIAMKVVAMKNDPDRSFQELADIQFLLRLPGVDDREVQRYFEQHGLREKFDELTRS
jgi:hypothetical protein